MYLDQRVAAVAGQELRLRGLVRTTRERAELEVGLCEKSFLASVRCSWARIPASHDWQPFEASLLLPKAQGTRIGPDAPLSLSLHNGAGGTRIEVTQLSLLGGATELLDNGSFERGMDRWLMYSDEHLAWRALNTWVQVGFEQGLVGVLAWMMLALVIIAAAMRRGGAAPLAASVAAAVAVVAVGCFDTLLDAPRVTVLSALVLWLAISSRQQVQPLPARSNPPPQSPAVSDARLD
jgi:hypothetical protein